MAGLFNNFNWAVNNQQKIMKLNNQYNQSFYNIPHYDVLIYGHIVVSAFTRLPPSGRVKDMRQLYGVSESYTNVTINLFRMISMRNQLQLR